MMKVRPPQFAAVRQGRADIVQDHVQLVNYRNIGAPLQKRFIAVALLRSVSRETRAVFSTSATLGRLRPKLAG
jgi:hypothetical protein